MTAIFSYPSFSIYKNPTMGAFEIATRDCYRSHEKMKDSSDFTLFDRILKNRHTAMIEFMDDLAVRLKVSRGVTHELVRQRICSFAQSSTRYIKYDEVEFIVPWWFGENGLEYCENEYIFSEDCVSCAEAYKRRIEKGWSAQKARGCLNADVAAFINMKTNIREWVHIFKLRTPKEAHPDMRVITCGLLSHLVEINPIFSQIVKMDSDLSANIEWFKAHYCLNPKINDLGLEEFSVAPRS